MRSLSVDADQALGSVFLASLRRRAAATPRRIVFAEGGDPRVGAAAASLLGEGIAVPVLLVDPETRRVDAAAEAAGCEVVDPSSDPRIDRAAGDLSVARAGHRPTGDDVRRLARHPLHFAASLVRHGDVDGSVAGAVATSADVLRAALWGVGLAAGVSTMSSAFYMVLADGRVLTFTDCGVVPEPTSDQLVAIAIAAAGDRVRIVGDTPRVALLSFSTKGSAAGASVERVAHAAARLRTLRPDLIVDGELQGDAAIVPAIGERKAPGSVVAGRANVLVFPSLDAGNISYKLVERLAGASAVGPIIQGLARPCSDLSRGASVDDIINVAAVTALQCGGWPKP
ncbi:MAG: phosphate acetyltransferase [Gemmatimonadaceae bacterium]